MRARMLPNKTFRAVARVLAALLGLAVAAVALAAMQAQKQEKKEEKKDTRAVLFTGFKKAEVQKTEQRGTTVSAGARGVGEGKQIGGTAVSAPDRDKVARMASAKPSPQEMQAFIEEGKLSTQRKGGSQ